MLTESSFNFMQMSVPLCQFALFPLPPVKFCAQLRFKSRFSVPVPNCWIFLLPAAKLLHSCSRHVLSSSEAYGGVSLITDCLFTYRFSLSRLGDDFYVTSKPAVRSHALFSNFYSCPSKQNLEMHTSPVFSRSPWLKQHHICVTCESLLCCLAHNSCKILLKCHKPVGCVWLYCICSMLMIQTSVLVGFVSARHVAGSGGLSALPEEGVVTSGFLRGGPGVVIVRGARLPPRMLCW